MARVFITGSTEGLGRAAAQTLIAEGHEVVVHARTKERVTALGPLGKRAAYVVVGDLSDAGETRGVADQVNQSGRVDAVIHNAGVYLEPARGRTAQGHARTFAINVLAPWLLTGLLERPQRLIYLSSGLHCSGNRTLDDIDWTKRRWDPGAAYADSKLQLTALAFAIARHWPQVVSSAVNPGWVPTRMGGPKAPDDLELGHLTQTWLAVSSDSDATTSGGYWHHRRREQPAAPVTDVAYQDELTSILAELTGVKLF
jgi:NAD(P)-dependent dehydrogenase (short-subunit alcohol dehydrogenase family)